MVNSCLRRRGFFWAPSAGATSPPLPTGEAAPTALPPAAPVTITARADQMHRDPLGEVECRCMVNSCFRLRGFFCSPPAADKTSPVTSASERASVTITAGGQTSRTVVLWAK